MPSARFHTSSDFDPKLRLLKTVAGLAVVLLLFLFFIVMALGSTDTLDAKSVSTKLPTGVYASAIYGRLTADDGETETIVAEGETLKTGLLYKIAEGNSTSIRFSREDADIVISGKALFTIGTRMDNTRLMIISGKLIAQIKSDLRQSMPIEIGALRIIPQSACRFDFVDGSPNRLSIYDGEISLVYNDSQETYMAGHRLLYDEKSVELEEFTVLPAPSPLSPASGTLFRKGTEAPLPLEFIWSEIADARNYQFQLATNLLFKSSIYERTVTSPRVTLPDLSQGTYYWRIIAIGETGAKSVPSEPVPFSVALMSNPDDEAVSAPDLEITEISSQSKLISIRGKTEPGARVRVRMESFGRIILDAMEILVQSSGDFVTLIEAPLSGQFEIFIEAYYRPEFVTTEKATIDVDF